MPINALDFSQIVAAIRRSHSKTTLQSLLPLPRVVGVFTLLRDFFLHARGEFAMALIKEADAVLESRWRRTDHLAHEKRPSISNIAIKDGEVAGVLSRTFVTLSSLGAQKSLDDEAEEEDECLELAREVMTMSIVKSTAIPRAKSSVNGQKSSPGQSFESFLLLLPTVISMKIPDTLDLFLTPSCIATYSTISAYLISLRRAHLHLSDLWKITNLRRNHPCPPGPPHGSTQAGREKVRGLRVRRNRRENTMRSIWATASATIFFLAEMEVWIQNEVLGLAWTEFQHWLTLGTSTKTSSGAANGDTVSQEDILSHDPATLTNAHRRYLKYLVTCLLLEQEAFIAQLFDLLQNIDTLVALVHRLDALWQAADLEADDGIIDAFSAGKDEADVVAAQLADVGQIVRKSVEGCVAALGAVVEDQHVDDAFSAHRHGTTNTEGDDSDDSDDGDEEDFGRSRYRPSNIARIDRLLMKLNFGSWVKKGPRFEEGGSQDEDDA